MTAVENSGAKRECRRKQRELFLESGNVVEKKGGRW
jgi:hypothetical protein